MQIAYTALSTLSTVQTQYQFYSRKTQFIIQLEGPV
jgi:hypothetical protein